MATTPDLATTPDPDGTRRWQTRQEWVAGAERYARMMWWDDTVDEVNLRPFLSHPELVEYAEARRSVYTQVRQVLTTRVKELRGLFLDRPRRQALAYMWVRDLDPAQRALVVQFDGYAAARLHIGHELKRDADCNHRGWLGSLRKPRLSYGREYCNEWHHRIERDPLLDEVAVDRETLSQMRKLEAIREQRWQEAFGEAMRHRISDTVAYRATPQAWEREKQRRAAIETLRA